MQVAASVGTMELTLSMAIIQETTTVTGMLVLLLLLLSVTGMLVDLSLAIMQMTFWCNYAVRSFCSTYAGDSFCSNVRVTIFLELYRCEPVAIMQVVFSVVDYAHDSFYCNYAGDSFLIAM